MVCVYCENAHLFFGTIKVLYKALINRENQLYRLVHNQIYCYWYHVGTIKYVVIGIMVIYLIKYVVIGIMMV